MAKTKTVNGIEYEITDCGKVLKNGKELSPFTDHWGYKRIRLGGRKGYLYLVHRLVAEAYIENTHGKPTVNHINGIKDDNRAVNLEWATHSENMKHSYDSGLR